MRFFPWYIMQNLNHILLSYSKFYNLNVPLKNSNIGHRSVKDSLPLNFSELRSLFTMIMLHFDYSATILESLYFNLIFISINRKVFNVSWKQFNIKLDNNGTFISASIWDAF